MSSGKERFQQTRTDLLESVLSQLSSGSSRQNLDSNARNVLAAIYNQGSERRNLDILSNAGRQNAANMPIFGEDRYQGGILSQNFNPPPDDDDDIQIIDPSSNIQQSSNSPALQALQSYGHAQISSPAFAQRNDFASRGKPSQNNTLSSFSKSLQSPEIHFDHSKGKSNQSTNMLSSFSKNLQSPEIHHDQTRDSESSVSSCQPFTSLDLKTVDEEDEFLYGDSNSLPEIPKSSGEDTFKLNISAATDHDMKGKAEWSDDDLFDESPEKSNVASVWDARNKKVEVKIHSQTKQVEKPNFTNEKLLPRRTPVEQPQKPLSSNPSTFSQSNVKKPSPKPQNVADKIPQGTTPGNKSKYHAAAQVLKKKTQERSSVIDKSFLNAGKPTAKLAAPNKNIKSLEKGKIDPKIDKSSGRPGRLLPKAFVPKYIENIKDYIKPERKRVHPEEEHGNDSKHPRYESSRHLSPDRHHSPYDSKYKSSDRHWSPHRYRSPERDARHRSSSYHSRYRSPGREYDRHNFNEGHRRHSRSPGRRSRERSPGRRSRERSPGYHRYKHHDSRERSRSPSARSYDSKRKISSGKFSDKSPSHYYSKKGRKSQDKDTDSFCSLSLGSTSSSSSGSSDSSDEKEKKTSKQLSEKPVNEDKDLDMSRLDRALGNVPHKGIEDNPFMPDDATGKFSDSSKPKSEEDELIKIGKILESSKLLNQYYQEVLEQKPSTFMSSAPVTNVTDRQAYVSSAQMPMSDPQTYSYMTFPQAYGGFPSMMPSAGRPPVPVIPQSAVYSVPPMPLSHIANHVQPSPNLTTVPVLPSPGIAMFPAKPPVLPVYERYPTSLATVDVSKSTKKPTMRTPTLRTIELEPSVSSTKKTHEPPLPPGTNQNPPPPPPPETNPVVPSPGTNPPPSTGMNPEQKNAIIEKYKKLKRDRQAAQYRMNHAVEDAVEMQSMLSEAWGRKVSSSEKVIHTKCKNLITVSTDDLNKYLQETKRLDEELRKFKARQPIELQVELANIKVVEDKEDITCNETYIVSDSGDHICYPCNKHLKSVSSYVEHIQTAEHKELSASDNNWMKDFKKDSRDLDPRRRGVHTAVQVTVKGTEFLKPLSGFYCALCKQVILDGRTAEEHVKSHDHHVHYKEFIKKHPFYVRKCMFTRLVQCSNVMKQKRAKEMEARNRALAECRKREETAERKAKEVVEKEKEVERKEDHDNSQSKNQESANKSPLPEEKDKEKEKPKEAQPKVLQKFIYIGKAPNYKKGLNQNTKQPWYKRESILNKSSEEEAGNTLSSPSVGIKKDKGEENSNNVISSTSVEESQQSNKPSRVDSSNSNRPSRVDSSNPNKPSRVDSPNSNKPSRVDSSNSNKPSRVDSSKSNKPSRVDSPKPNKPSGVDSSKSNKPSKEDAQKSNKLEEKRLQKSDKGDKTDSHGSNTPKSFSGSPADKAEVATKKTSGTPFKYTCLTEEEAKNSTDGKSNTSSSEKPEKKSGVQHSESSVSNQGQSMPKSADSTVNWAIKNILLGADASAHKDIALSEITLPDTDKKKAHGSKGSSQSAPQSEYENTPIPMEIDNSQDTKSNRLATEEEKDFYILGINKEDLKPLVIPVPPPSYSGSTNVANFLPSNAAQQQFDFSVPPPPIVPSYSRTAPPPPLPYSNMHAQPVHPYPNPNNAVPMTAYPSANTPPMYPYANPNVPPPNPNIPPPNTNVPPPNTNVPPPNPNVPPPNPNVPPPNPKVLLPNPKVLLPNPNVPPPNRNVPPPSPNVPPHNPHVPPPNPNVPPPRLPFANSNVGNRAPYIPYSSSNNMPPAFSNQNNSSFLPGVPGDSSVNKSPVKGSKTIPVSHSPIQNKPVVKRPVLIESKQGGRNLITIVPEARKPILEKTEKSKEGSPNIGSQRKDSNNCTSKDGKSLDASLNTGVQEINKSNPKTVSISKSSIDKQSVNSKKDSQAVKTDVKSPIASKRSDSQAVKTNVKSPSASKKSDSQAVKTDFKSPTTSKKADAKQLKKVAANKRKPPHEPEESESTFEECEIVEEHDECEVVEEHDECEVVEEHDECEVVEEHDECEVVEEHEECEAVDEYIECEDDEHGVSEVMDTEDEKNEVDKDEKNETNKDDDFVLLDDYYASDPEESEASHSPVEKNAVDRGPLSCKQEGEIQMGDKTFSSVLSAKENENSNKTSTNESTSVVLEDSSKLSKEQNILSKGDQSVQPSTDVTGNERVLPTKPDSDSTQVVNEISMESHSENLTVSNIEGTADKLSKKPVVCTDKNILSENNQSSLPSTTVTEVAEKMSHSENAIISNLEHFNELSKEQILSTDKNVLSEDNQSSLPSANVAEINELPMNLDIDSTESVPEISTGSQCKNVTVSNAEDAANKVSKEQIPFTDKKSFSENNQSSLSLKNVSGEMSELYTKLDSNLTEVVHETSTGSHSKDVTVSNVEKGTDSKNVAVGNIENLASKDQGTLRDEQVSDKSNSNIDLGSSRSSKLEQCPEVKEQAMEWNNSNEGLKSSESPVLEQCLEVKEQDMEWENSNDESKNNQSPPVLEQCPEVKEQDMEWNNSNDELKSSESGTLEQCPEAAVQEQSVCKNMVVNDQQSSVNVDVTKAPVEEEKDLSTDKNISVECNQTLITKLESSTPVKGLERKDVQMEEQVTTLDYVDPVALANENANACIENLKTLNALAQEQVVSTDKNISSEGNQNLVQESAVPVKELEQNALAQEKVVSTNENISTKDNQNFVQKSKSVMPVKELEQKDVQMEEQVTPLDNVDSVAVANENASACIESLKSLNALAQEQVVSTDESISSEGNQNLVQESAVPVKELEQKDVSISSEGSQKMESVVPEKEVSSPKKEDDQTKKQKSCTQQENPPAATTSAQTFADLSSDLEKLEKAVSEFNAINLMSKSSQVDQAGVSEALRKITEALKFASAVKGATGVLETEKTSEQGANENVKETDNAS